MLHAESWQALRNFYKVRLVIVIPPQILISATVLQFTSDHIFNASETAVDTAYCMYFLEYAEP